MTRIKSVVRFRSRVPMVRVRKKLTGRPDLIYGRSPPILPARQNPGFHGRVDPDPIPEV